MLLDELGEMIYLWLVLFLNFLYLAIHLLNQLAQENLRFAARLDWLAQCFRLLWIPLFLVPGKLYRPYLFSALDLVEFLLVALLLCMLLSVVDNKICLFLLWRSLLHNHSPVRR